MPESQSSHFIYSMKRVWRLRLVSPDHFSNQVLIMLFTKKCPHLSIERHQNHSRPYCFRRFISCHYHVHALDVYSKTIVYEMCAYSDFWTNKINKVENMISVGSDCKQSKCTCQVKEVWWRPSTFWIFSPFFKFRCSQTESISPSGRCAFEAIWWS